MREREEIEYFLICYVYMDGLSNACMVTTITINGLGTLTNGKKLK